MHRHYACSYEKASSCTVLIGHDEGRRKLNATSVVVVPDVSLKIGYYP